DGITHMVDAIAHFIAELVGEFTGAAPRPAHALAHLVADILGELARAATRLARAPCKTVTCLTPGRGCEQQCRTGTDGQTKQQHPETTGAVPVDHDYPIVVVVTRHVSPSSANVKRMGKAWRTHDRVRPHHRTPCSVRKVRVVRSSHNRRRARRKRTMLLGCM